MISYAIAALAVLWIVSPPARIERVTLANPSASYVTIQARAAGAGGWLTLGSVARNSSRTVSGVLDLGDAWELRTMVDGRVVGFRTVAKDDLTANGWRIDAPITA